MNKVDVGESAASFCHQVTTWFPDMFYNFYLVKNQKMLKTQQPLKLENKTQEMPMKFLRDEWGRGGNEALCREC